MSISDISFLNFVKTPLILRFFSEVTPSILHRYSIVTLKIKSKKEKIKSGESRPLALKLIILFIFSFLLYTFSALRSSLSGQS